MRVVAAVVAPFVAGVVPWSCGPPPTATSLPPIREPFTLLPCPADPVSTVDIEGCMEHEIVAGDAAIDRRRRVLLARLTPEGRRAFVRAEQAWLAYRQSFCAAVEAKVVGGTLRPLLFADCVRTRNRQHLRDLAEAAAPVERGG